MFFPRIDVKNDPFRRWHRPDRHFFANGACQVLAFAFLERYPDMGFHARWIKPADGFTGNHIYVADCSLSISAGRGGLQHRYGVNVDVRHSRFLATSCANY